MQALQMTVYILYIIETDFFIIAVFFTQNATHAQLISSFCEGLKYDIF